MDVTYACTISSSCISRLTERVSASSSASTSSSDGLFSAAIGATGGSSVLLVLDLCFTVMNYSSAGVVGTVVGRAIEVQNALIAHVRLGLVARNLSDTAHQVRHALGFLHDHLGGVALGCSGRQTADE